MQSLDKILNIKYPIIMAPMFLVTTVDMLKSALDNGITGAIPAMNFRKKGELLKAILELKSYSDKPFGVNLITNKSNPRYKHQLKEILEAAPAFVISSLGNPSLLIKEAHKQKIKVFCDVVNLKHAKIVENLGADAIIAVNSKAGGHCGNLPPEELIPLLASNCNIPIINAGGVTNYSDLQTVMDLGAVGASIGTIFIASKESPVSDEYKNALIEFGKDDIVLTTKLSGVPITVINTEYVKTIGTKQTLFESFINKHKFLKKFTKNLFSDLGMKSLRDSAFKASYKNVWCAGPGIEDIKSIRPISKIIKDITEKK